VVPSGQQLRQLLAGPGHQLGLFAVTVVLGYRPGGVVLHRPILVEVGGQEVLQGGVFAHVGHGVVGYPVTILKPMSSMRSERSRTSFTEYTSSAESEPRTTEMPVLESKLASITRRLPPAPSSHASTRSWFSIRVSATRRSASGRSMKLDAALMLSRLTRSTSHCSLLPTWRSIRWPPASSWACRPPPGTSGASGVSTGPSRASSSPRVASTASRSVYDSESAGSSCSALR